MKFLKCTRILFTGEKYEKCLKEDILINLETVTAVFPKKIMRTEQDIVTNKPMFKEVIEVYDVVNDHVTIDLSLGEFYNYVN